VRDGFSQQRGVSIGDKKGQRVKLNGGGSRTGTKGGESEQEVRGSPKNIGMKPTRVGGGEVFSLHG